jgi:hypothetical protein
MGGFSVKKGTEPMIANPASLATLQAQWEDVVRMRERIRQLVFSTFAFNTFISPIFGDMLYNLPLQLAFEVLKQVLLQAREEGLITSSPPRLANLIESAKPSLSWIDWQALREGVKRRNEAKFNSKLLGDRQCLQDIANIEAQLLAWGIISSTYP